MIRKKILEAKVNKLKKKNEKLRKENKLLRGHYQREQKVSVKKAKLLRKKGYSYSQIGKMLGVSRQAIHQRIGRSEKKKKT